MTDMMSCSYTGDREQSLIAYLYGDIDPSERAAFSAHLVACERCRRDLAALGGVRRQLAQWAPPEPALEAARRPPTGVRRVWWEIPAWAQVAAALLFVGVAAGAAHLDVRYDTDGLSVRTGWSKAAAAAPPSQPPGALASNVATRDDLAAVTRQLRAELQAPAPVRAASTDADAVRRVRALIDESEKRQQRELALRIAQVLRDVNAQRQVDLSNIDRNLGLFQNKAGVEILKQREMVNYLMRVSQRQ
ncbi:MAG TPA: zf-HC2 domain-containing protein [Actinomycetota bacterium]|nr:zf-HC2 domain-containing protein [Actinomycetota bacterium]